MPDAPIAQPAPPPPAEPLLVETPRGFALTWMLAGFLVAAMLADVWLGAFVTHAIAWGVAFVVVVGLDYLVARSAQRWHSLVVTKTSITIGADVLERQQISGISDSEAMCHRILGRSLGQGMPRGKKELRLHLTDDTEIIVPTSQPERLAELIEAAAGIHEDFEVLTQAGSTPDGEGDGEGHGEGERQGENVQAPFEELWERACSLYVVSGLPVPIADHATPALAVFTAMHDGEPIGYARLIALGSVAYLAEVAILPSHMRRGFGAALVAQACEWAAGHGHDVVEATAFTQVPWSIDFLRSCGFRVESPANDPRPPELTSYSQARFKAATGKLREQVAMRRPSAASE